MGVADRARQSGQLAAAILFVGAALDEHLRALCAMHNVQFAGFKLTSERLAKAGICSAHDAQQITLWAAQFSKSEKQLGRFSEQEVTHGNVIGAGANAAGSAISSGWSSLSGSLGFGGAGAAGSAGGASGSWGGGGSFGGSGASGSWGDGFSGGGGSFGGGGASGSW